MSSRRRWRTDLVTRHSSPVTLRLLLLAVLLAAACNPVTTSGQRLSLEEIVDGTATPTRTATVALVVQTPTATPTVQVIELRTATPAPTPARTPAPPSATAAAAAPTPTTAASGQTPTVGLNLTAALPGTATPVRSAAVAVQTTATTAPPAPAATQAAPPPPATATPTPTETPTITPTPTRSPTPTPIGWVQPVGTPQPQPTTSLPVRQPTAPRTSAAITGRLFLGSTPTTGRVQLERTNGTALTTVATNPDGIYRFDQVVSGTYRVHALPPDGTFVDDAVDTVTLGLLDAYRELSLTRRIVEQSPTHKGRLCIGDPLVWNAPAGINVATYRVSLIPLQVGVREESGPLTETSYLVASQLRPANFYQWVVRAYDANGRLVAKTDEGKSDRRFTFTAVTCAAPTPTP